MFKENYIQELAMHNIKKERHLYKYMLIAMILSFFLTSFLSIMFSSYEQIAYEERANQYGKWSVAIDNKTREEVSVDVDCEIGKIYYISNVYDNGRMLGTLGSMDELGIELVNTQIIKGRIPKNNQEIMIEQDICDYLGVSNQLNQTITINMIQNNQNVKKAMKLVGITENMSSTYPIEIPSFITCDVSDDFTLLLRSKHNLELMNYFVDTNQEKDVVYNYCTYTQYVYSSDRYIESNTTRYMEYFIICVGVMGIILTMLSVVNKRSQYFTLMRTLGATMFQIQKMVLYESAFLMIPSLLIGVIGSLLTSIICLFVYSIIVEGIFIISISTNLVKINVLLILVMFISMFMISLSIYNVPLTNRIKQRTNILRTNKVRKLNIVSLSVLEINSNRKMFLLLGIISSIVLMLTCSVMSLCDSYFNQSNEIGFTHYLSGHRLTQQDFETISNINHLESIYFQYEQIKMHVNGLENWDGQYIEDVPMSSTQYWMSNCVISSFMDHNETFENIISQQYFNGRLPQSDYETLVIIPFIDTSNHRTSFSPIDSQTIEHHHIQIGDEIDVVDVFNNLIPQKLKVVGTIMYKMNDQRMSDITTYGGYQFVVMDSTFSSLFKEATYKKIYINAYENQTIHEMKSTVYQILRNKSDLDYTDNISMDMFMQTQNKRDFIKNISFTCLFIIGIIMFMYIQRKLRILAIEYDIGLMMAIGLTQSQLILIYVVYDLFVYMLGVLFLIIYCIVTNANQLYVLKNIILSQLFVISMMISSIVVSLSMIWPVLVQKNKSMVRK